MKSKFFIFILLVPQISICEDFNIQAEIISINKQKELSLFENNV